MKSDIRIIDVETYTLTTHCRTPLKFGAVVVEELPIVYAKVTVENRARSMATGWGAMFLMDLWAWPVSKADHEAKNRVMCELFEAYATTIRHYRGFGHPLEIFMETQEELSRLNRSLCAALTPDEVMPHLGALICASPLDHALHDAFGFVNGIDSYWGYGPDHMWFDLSRYLGPAYTGVYPSQFLRQEYAPRVPIFHLVGGLDPLRREEVSEDLPQDGLPNSLDDWIEQDGVFCLKIKLRGRDLAWDLARTVDVAGVYAQAREGRRGELPVRPHLTVDTNEQCESPEYMIEYLRKLREQAPQVYEDVLYLEQPTGRDLEEQGWDMRELAQLKPVLIDESLATIDDFAQARALGWSGIALKSCKCLSSDLLFVPLAELNHVPYAIQDLTNPSLALIASVGLAARTHPIMGVECNSRQFFPDANVIETRRHPGLYRVRDGHVSTTSLRGPGLGMQMNQMLDLQEHIAGTRG